MKQREALKILEKTPLREWDNEGIFALRFLLLLNDFCKKKYKIRLYNIFEIIGVNKDNSQVVLSYTISNIEELFKSKIKEK
jgi:hypothetical protein